MQMFDSVTGNFIYFLSNYSTMKMFSAILNRLRILGGTVHVDTANSLHLYFYKYPILQHNQTQVKILRCS